MDVNEIGKMRPGGKIYGKTPKSNERRTQKRREKEEKRVRQKKD